MDVNRTFSDVRKVLLFAHKSTGAEEKVAFYNDWASNYDQDVGILEYRAPSLAAELLSAAYRGNRDTAAVLDVACGTGLVCAQLHNMGFRNVFGVDGSQSMLDIAKRKGLYKELKQCMLGMEPLPVQAGSFDAVLIVGILSAGNVPVTVVKELWQVAKPGGYVCMTTRADVKNLKYKTELENTIDGMEQDGLWVRVDVREVEQWERAVSNMEAGHIPGVVYLYRKSLD
ncbi:methyltransferase-like protein 27 [Brienomyrus brachyistius]|uniref:methyltransferase-like protein 27 n=1 Tax=Brienomyrus brachyistius TaxID=42636 RepID=UPI0020B42B50|nr:methyltransferase-like protein 27 [Brienomyrus brachyistius]